MSHVDTASFELRYQRDPDPWAFATSFHETRRYEITMAALPRHHFRHAFEPACANGELTWRLAGRCDAVTALDCSATAVARARARCADRPGATIMVGELPAVWPHGHFDLVVLSELGYYFDHLELAWLRKRTIESLPRGGHLIAVHWLGESEDHILSGDDVHQALDTGPGLTARGGISRRPVPARRVGARVTAASACDRVEARATMWRVGVVVPARDEELLLGRCLRSVERAVARSGVPPDHVRIVVVADGCTDGTAELAVRMLDERGEVIEIDKGSAGWARHLGADRILERFAMVPRERVWLANTDADSTVPSSWLADQLELADRGVAAIAGIVKVDSFRDHPAVVRRRFRLCYDGPTDEHPHVHGANLGVRGDAYEAVGGWPAINLAEDHGLWHALAAGGWPTVSTRSLFVTTSGRGIGRAAGGFADLLTALGEDG